MIREEKKYEATLKVAISQTEGFKTVSKILNKIK